MPRSDNDERGPQAIEIVQVILESILLRREKRMKDREGKPLVPLPKKTVKIEELSLSKRERQIYDFIYRNAKRQFMGFQAKGTVLNNFTAIFAVLMRLRQAVLHPFLVVEKVDGIRKGAKQLVGAERKDEDIVQEMIANYVNGEGAGFATQQLEELQKRLLGDGNATEEECILCLDVGPCLLSRRWPLTLCADARLGRLPSLHARLLQDLPPRLHRLEARRGRSLLTVLTATLTCAAGQEVPAVRARVRRDRAAGVRQAEAAGKASSVQGLELVVAEQPDPDPGQRRVFGGRGSGCRTFGGRRHPRRR